MLLWSNNMSKTHVYTRIPKFLFGFEKHMPLNNETKNEK